MSIEATRLLGARAPSPVQEVSTTCVSGSVLLDNEVHIWRVSLNQSSERTAFSFEVLSPDERAKAARFHFDKDRNQFVQARAALRFILSEYLDADPRTLEFSYGPQGKPCLVSEVRECGTGVSPVNHAQDARATNKSLRFNLSRRDGLALIAVTRDREIGVDVELVRADLSFFQIADVSFSSTEVATLRNLPESARVKGFYNCWTRKEAYVKAHGAGLSFPLKQFDVSLTPGDPSQLLQIHDDLDRIDRWTMREIPVAENYVAALVVEGTDLNVMCRDSEPFQATCSSTDGAVARP